ncbi:hypothetical protein BDP67DRAFT_148243 [Colletotrichum lupini]|nr:hypothetical protein BDP67DRAFT_148243 [Colletotrichum lupini]
MRNGEETMLCIHPDPGMYGYKATWDDALPYSIRPKREEKQQQDTRLRENSDAKIQGHCRCQTEQGGDSRKCEAPRRNHGRNRPATATEMKKRKKKRHSKDSRAWDKQRRTEKKDPNGHFSTHARIPRNPACRIHLRRFSVLPIVTPPTTGHCAPSFWRYPSVCTAYGCASNSRCSGFFPRTLVREHERPWLMAPCRSLGIWFSKMTGPGRSC